MNARHHDKTAAQEEAREAPRKRQKPARSQGVQERAERISWWRRMFGSWETTCKKSP